MKSSLTSLALFLTFGCATAEAPPPAQPETPSSSAAQPTAAVAAGSTVTPAAPSPEEIAKAEEQKKLEQDFAKLEADHAAELARLTPELRAEVKKLTEKGAAGIKTAINTALKGPQRRPGHAERDAQRHPADTLSFIGLQPSHKVLEYGPGEGWYTELLAPALAKRGKLYVTLNDPTGPTTERATWYGKRTQLQLDSLPEAYSAVERVLVNPKQPALTIPDGTLDAVLLFRGAHGMVNNGVLDAWLAEFHRVLEPKGILGIEQHRAAAGADPIQSAKAGYLPEAYVIEQVLKAGFKLAAKSELNANPKDTKDHVNGVWSLPPTFAGGETDRAKYAAIGESDRMTLKFIKTDRPKPSTAAASTPAAGGAPAVSASPAGAAPAATAQAPKPGSPAPAAGTAPLTSTAPSTKAAPPAATPAVAPKTTAVPAAPNTTPASPKPVAPSPAVPATPAPGK